jgi:hypothetical protein
LASVRSGSNDAKKWAGWTDAFCVSISKKKDFKNTVIKSSHEVNYWQITGEWFTFLYQFLFDSNFTIMCF